MSEMAPQGPAGQGGEAAEPAVQELLNIRLGAHAYLIRLHEVREIVRPSPLTPVPMAPDHLLGLANIQGQIACIIDPCRTLHLDARCQPRQARTRYVVLRHPSMHVGIWVDEVASISQVPTAELPPQEEAGDDVASLGVVPGGGELLNARALFRC